MSMKILRHKKVDGKWSGKILGKSERQIYEKLVNLSPHPVYFCTHDDTLIEIPMSGQVLRVTEEVQLVRYIGEIPVYQCTTVHVPEIKDYDPEKIYIVSSKTADNLGKGSLVIPYDYEREGNGKILYARGLLQV